MIRINLLPPEIVEKRRVESRRLLLVASGLAVLAVLGLVWAFGAVVVMNKETTVASQEQAASAAAAQAEQFKIFSDRSSELAKRQQVADTAIAGRIDWSRLMSDVALVLPSQLWLEKFTGTQVTAAVSNTPGKSSTTTATAGGSAGGTGATLNLGGWSLYSSKAADGGFKPVAKLLVRLDGLSQLKNVWLESAELRTKGFKNQDAVNWGTVADIATPESNAASATTSVVPGPGKP